MNWPSQSGPLPIEKTSILVRLVISAATLAGTTSISMAMQPAASSAITSSYTFFASSQVLPTARGPPNQVSLTGK